MDQSDVRNVCVETYNELMSMRDWPEVIAGHFKL